MKIDPAMKYTLFILFLIIYGAGVFLLTRGYYKTEAPPRPVQTVAPQFPTGIFRDMPRDIPISNLQIQKAGNNPGLLTQLGKSYFGLGQYSQAIQAYEKVLSLNGQVQGPPLQRNPESMSSASTSFTAFSICHITRRQRIHHLLK